MRCIEFRIMTRKKGDYIEGKDIMLYVNTGMSEETPTYTATAAAKSHSIKYSGDTKERVTKDSGNGAWSEKRVTKLSVSIKVDALVVFNADCGYDKLLEIMKSRKPVLLKYGYKEEETGDTYEEGKFLITDLEKTDSAEDDSTYSASFENTGEVTTKTKAA